MPDESFDEFFRRDYPSLVAFLRKLGFDRESAEDAAEDAMIDAYENWDALRWPRAYVRKAAQHAAGGQAKRDRARVQLSIVGGWLPGSQDDTLKHAEIEEKESILSLLATLPHRCREVVVWYLDGFSTNEIAEHLRVTSATVRSQLRHARDALKKAFQNPTQRASDEPVLSGGSTAEVEAKEVPQNGSNR
jgi:RNA polymerase sigma factor (sigma-70 family)